MQNRGKTQECRNKVAIHRYRGNDENYNTKTAQELNEDGEQFNMFDHPMCKIIFLWGKDLKSGVMNKFEVLSPVSHLCFGDGGDGLDIGQGVGGGGVLVGALEAPPVAPEDKGADQRKRRRGGHASVPVEIPIPNNHTSKKGFFQRALIA